VSNEQVRLDKCSHCGSANIEEVGWDIYEADDDVISELQYKCDDCGKLSFARNSAKKCEFTLNLSALIPEKPDVET